MLPKTTLRLLVLTTATMMAVGAAQANNFSKGTYDGAKDDVKSVYKAERDACSKHSGNAKDICIEQAKGREKIALAQLEYNYTGTEKDEMKLWEVKADARYDIAKEKCDDLAGNAKDVCVRKAKTDHDKSKADLKLAKKSNEAIDDAETAHMKADYKLAIEKCDTYSGDKKDVCVASAKAQYNER